MSSTSPGHDLGLEHLGLFGMSPVALVHLAADLGCVSVGIVLQGRGGGPDGHAPFSLRDDLALRHELIGALDERDVSVSLGDGFLVDADFDADGAESDLDVLVELDARRINAVCFDPDRARAFDHLGLLVALSVGRGIDVVVEFVPGTTVPSLEVAVDAVRHVGHPRLQVLVDTMHLARSGATADDLRALDPALIGHVQLCDVPSTPQVPDYFQEAMGMRRPPGEGELPLAEILAALPPSVPIGLEVPMRAEATSGVGPRERMKRCVDGARRLLA